VFARGDFKEQYMRTKQRLNFAALASAIGVTGMVFTSEATRLTAIDAATSPVGPDIGDCGARGNNRTQGENLDAWLNKHATTHDGRIAREEFMNQMSRRWDMLDARRSGYMTPDQARRIYM
jgi:hypothetical protein